MHLQLDTLDRSWFKGQRLEEGYHLWSHDENFDEVEAKGTFHWSNVTVLEPSAKNTPQHLISCLCWLIRV